MKEKEYLVAVSYDENRNCKDIHKVINVKESDFKVLVNQKNAYKTLLEKKEYDHLKTLSELTKKTSNHDYIIAKSVYDNFVDRGLLEDDEEFQRMWFEHVLNKESFVLDKAPQEFKTILDFVRGI